MTYYFYCKIKHIYNLSLNFSVAYFCLYSKKTWVTTILHSR